MQHTPVAYVVDDDPAILESIGWLLRSLDIPFQPYASALDFLAAYQPGAPCCLILDIRMPGMSGVELQELLVKRNILIPIIFITAHGDVPVAVRAMKSGALEFLSKPFAQQDLSNAIQRAFALAQEQHLTSTAESSLKSRIDSLTPREREILLQLINGRSAKEIGKLLSISPRTVEYHRKNILEKMASTSLVSLAAQLGNQLQVLEA